MKRSSGYLRWVIIAGFILALFYVFPHVHRKKPQEKREFVLQKKQHDEKVFTDFNGETLYISPGTAETEPEMPQIKADYSGTYKAEYKIRYGVQKDYDEKIYDIVGYQSEGTEKLSTVSQKDKLIVGGKAFNGAIKGRTVSGVPCSASIRCRETATGKEHSIGFSIKGKNPSYCDVNKFVKNRKDALTAKHEGELIDFRKYYRKILFHESGYKQFNDGEEFHGEPNYGGPYGWGIAQVDDKNSDERQSRLMWNWHFNVSAGIEIFNSKFGEVKYLSDKIRNWNNSLPPLTKEQFIRAAVVAYNGFAGTARVKVGENTRTGADVTVLFCYPASWNGERWEDFRDNENRYWEIVEETEIPQDRNE